MEVNATTPMHNAALSDGMSRANNRNFNFALQDYLMGRKPDYWVYLFSISEQSYFVFRPPLLANLNVVGLDKSEKVNIKEVAGIKYAQVARFPQPLLTPQGSVDSDEVTIMPMDTRRFVMDIINPDNLGFDQDTLIAKPSNVGNDLGKKGVFWSLNEVPTEAELKAAQTRMEKYYNTLLEKARATETSDPKSLVEMLTPEYHTAADYYNVETSWHGKRSRPMDCPQCGDRIKVGVAFHRTEEGGMCILDWTRAVKAGVRTIQQAIDSGAPGFDDVETARITLGQKPKAE